MAMKRAGTPRPGDKMVTLRSKKTGRRIQFLVRARRVRDPRKINPRRVANQRLRIKNLRHNIA